MQKNNGRPRRYRDGGSDSQTEDPDHRGGEPPGVPGESDEEDGNPNRASIARRGPQSARKES